MDLTIKDILLNNLDPTIISQEIAKIEKEAELIKAQRALQMANMGGECFFPYNGRCYSCGANLPEKVGEEKMKTALITGCPSCHRSFC